MTSAEIGPYPVEAEAEAEDESSGGSLPEAGTPWAIGERRRWGAGGNNGSPAGPPGAPSGQTAPSGTATPASNVTPAPSAVAPSPGPATPAVSSVVPVANTVPQPTPGPAAPATPLAAAQPAAPPPTAPGPAAEEGKRAEPEPLVDPETLAQMAPMALMAGTALLPMIGSALSGLLGGGGSGVGAAVPVGEADGAGMSPEAQRAMKVLEALEAVYGEGEPKDPEAKKLREELGGSSAAGSGEGPAMVKAKRLFQANRATAFNNLDKQFANYISGLAGANKVDKAAVQKLLKQVNEALAELGPMAYTKEGQQKVRAILTAALQTAHKIVSGGSANAGDTASAIDQLTNQYLYNILGKELPGGVRFANASGTDGGGASARAQHALKTAIAQIGDPYVWGAEGPDSFDCSGLMQYAAKKAGVDIPRVADDQYRQIPRVKNSEIKPGDLIFPASSYKNGEMGHVMMYVGNGKCVHAPGRGQSVEYTDLPSSFAAGRYA